MDLSLSPEQQELVDSIRRFTAEQVTPERLAEWSRTPDGVDEGFWRDVAALGWLGLGMPVSRGGSGLDLVDLAVLLSECGRGLVPLVVSTTVRGADALHSIAPEAPELADVATGGCRIALAIDEEHAEEPAAFRCRLEGEQLEGSKWYVQQASSADYYLVAARDDGELVLVLAPREAAKLVPLRPFASGDAQAIVTFAGDRIRGRLCSGRNAEAQLRRIRRRQTALALAEMIGGMEAVLEKTVAYVKEREQFGQKIGVFQAVQHQVADMATAYTAARHLGWQAITRVAEDRDEPIDLPAAAAWMGTAFKQLAVTGHHLHGGAGFVVEHPLHHHSERAQSLAIRHTRERQALADVAAALLDT